MKSIPDTLSRRQTAYLSWICSRFELYNVLDIGLVDVHYNYPKKKVAISSVGTNPVRSIRRRFVPINSFPSQETVIDTIELFGAACTDRYSSDLGLYKMAWSKVTLADFMRFRTTHMKKKML